MKNIPTPSTAHRPVAYILADDSEYVWLKLELNYFQLNLFFPLGLDNFDDRFRNTYATGTSSFDPHLGQR